MIESELIAVMSVVVDISRELEDDHVELWKLPKNLRAVLPSADDDQIQGITRAMLIALLDSNVVLGDLSGKTGLFEPWPEPVASIDIAMAMWRDLGRDPNIGDVAWLSRLPRAD
ncbi:hypothetical protein V5P93_003006 [Actinokineospora auranticolor]|uniref:Uncharacterized protein n=1 Tax=Actinokineospora auranticolor TaxID=155976 RepID=A0A2S6H100_9PSEU|nr:hypothetical protein [Actinokineospora auranticolor]PPK71143.1 hypothetical protein CLV40_101332 [Actinokineospora auranticolor]